MSKKNILDLFKYIIKSYLGAFIVVSVVVTVLAAIKSSQLLWVLNYTLWMWLIAEVLVYIIRMVIKFINKLKKRGE